MNNRLRYLIVGSGWRSLFYVRVAKALPEHFEACALLCRTREKADKIQYEYGIRASISIEECKAMKPDFVVVAVDKPSIYPVSRFWMESGFPVLCETPPALDQEGLYGLWRLRTEKGCKIQVAEQYLDYPSIACRLEAVSSGILGEPSFLRLSMAHGYHGASLIRRFLKVGREPVTICGKAYPVSIVETDSRWGPVTDGPMADKKLERLTFEFESGKVAFYDFCNVQYHSFLRGRHLNVQGPFGEIDGFTVRFLDGNRKPVKQEMTIQAGRGEDSIETVSLGGRIMYKNPYPKSGLPQDETALAVALKGMGTYINMGIEHYPLADALEDAYLACLMDEALSQPGKAVRSDIQPWS